jgi:hypothetical protein
MATVILYDNRGLRTARVEFESQPPDTAAVVYSEAGHRVGTIKSEHGWGNGTVYDALGREVGTLYGDARADNTSCVARDRANATVGGVTNAGQVMVVNATTQWGQAGTVETQAWTPTDDAGLEATLQATGKGDQGTAHWHWFSNMIRVKQRNLAGVAAVLLRQMGTEGVLPGAVYAGQGGATTGAGVPAHIEQAASATKTGQSFGCLFVAFVFAPWLWAVIILTEKNLHANWVRVAAWVVLAWTVVVFVAGVAIALRG